MTRCAPPIGRVARRARHRPPAPVRPAGRARARRRRVRRRRQRGHGRRDRAAGPCCTRPACPADLVLDALARRCGRPFPGSGWRRRRPAGSTPSPDSTSLAPLTKADAIVVDDASPRPDDAVHSAVLFVLGGDTRDVLAQVAAVLPDGVDVSPSGLPGSVELTPPGVHKGSGVAHLCERLGVDRRDVVAFGDGLNDHEMLTLGRPRGRDGQRRPGHQGGRRRGHRQQRRRRRGASSSSGCVADRERRAGMDGVTDHRASPAGSTSRAASTSATPAAGRRPDGGRCDRASCSARTSRRA